MTTESKDTQEENATGPLVSRQTRTAEAQDALAGHQADRMPTAEEEELADESAGDPGISGDQRAVADHYREMAERGVDQRGEGRIP